MNVLNYLIEANAGIVICYALYECLLSRETNFGLQRRYLLIGLAASLLLPLLDFSGTMPGSSNSGFVTLPEFVVRPEQSIATLATNQPLTLADTLWLVYLAGIGLLLTPVLIQALRIYVAFRRQEGWHEGPSYIVESSRIQATYSFFNLIMVGMADRLSIEEKKLVILHEQFHGRMLHSVDVLVATILCVAFWFNPAVWLCRKRLINVHEFQADRFVTNMTSPDDYTALLAKSAIIGNGLQLTHSLSQSFILKRINMINQLQKKVGNWKLLTVGIAALAFATAVSCTDQVSQSEISTAVSEKVVPARVVERLALLRKLDPSGQYSAIPMEGDFLELNANPAAQSVEWVITAEDQGMWAIVNSKPATTEVLFKAEHSARPADGMSTYYQKLSKVLTYPRSAREQGIEGKVFVEFVVLPDGRLSNFKVLRGLGADCDAAAVAAIAAVQEWTPAINDGKPVAQRMVMPITFKLQ